MDPYAVVFMESNAHDVLNFAFIPIMLTRMRSTFRLAWKILEPPILKPKMSVDLSAGYAMSQSYRNQILVLAS